MRRIRLDFSNYADGALLVLARAIVAALTGNAYFPSLTNPSLADFQTVVNTYGTALAAAADRSKNNVATKNTAKQALIDTLTKVATECTQVANGNEDALISTSFPLTKIRGPQPPLEVPVIAKIENGINSGELIITLFSLPNARTFLYQYTLDPLTESSEWLSLNSTVIKETLAGLQPGKRYWIKIIAYGIDNQMTVSDPILSKFVQ